MLNSNNQSNKLNQKTELVCYLFSIFSFLILLYTLFSEKTELQKQSINWFYLSFIAALIPGFGNFILSAIVPNLKGIKIQQLEITFREEFQRLGNELEKKIERKTEELQSSLVSAVESVKLRESKLSDEYKRMRDNSYQRYAENLNSLPADVRLERQRHYTLEHLNNARITVRNLKEMLSGIGIHNGEIDDEFNESLAQSISKFQETYRVTPIDGTCGPKTLSKIAEVLSKNKEHPTSTN